MRIIHFLKSPVALSLAALSLLTPVALSADVQSSGAGDTAEKAAVEQILAGNEPADVEQRFSDAVRRIDNLGGRFEFDRAGKLVGIDLAGDRVSLADADLPFLRSLPHIVKLKLSGAGISNAGVRQISEHRGLTELFLLDAQVDDAGLARLAQLSNLQSLIIRRSPLLTDEGISHLRRLTKLVNLGLLDVGITDRGVAALVENAPSLIHLDLRGCTQISDAGLERLRGLKNLKKLQISGYQITDASLAIVKKYGLLSELTIEDAAVTDAGLAQLADVPLDEFRLSRCHGITDAGFEHIAKLENLRRLDIRGIPIEGAGLKHIHALDRLVQLDLSSTGVGDDAMKHLGALTELRSLNLQQTQVTDASLDAIIGLKRLAVLNISETDISDDGANRLKKSLPKCKIIQ